MKEIDSLVYTSADDLRSQLNYYKSMGTMPDIEILRSAHALCISLGYKTKANHLTRAINKINKDRGQ